MPTRAAFCALILAIAPRLTEAQGGATPPTEVATAQAALRAGHADSAIATLEALFRRRPDESTGRLLLAAAYRQRGDFDRALSTLMGISQPRPMRLQARFNAAAIHALQGRADSSLQLLGELKGTGAFDVELARSSSDFDALRQDARFEAVMFRPADFTSPFVEPVRIIHEFVGETKGDQFGWIARRLGDVDGDAVGDLVTSAPSYATTAPSGAALLNRPPPSAGRVYVYSGRTGRIVWMQTGAVGDNLGTGLESAGDVNGDGVADVVAGAPGNSRAYVYSGRDGRLLHTLSGATADEAFGQSASGVGDQDGDGVADIMIGAPSSRAADGAGRAYVFSGRDGSMLFALDGERRGAAFGSIVAGAKSGRAALLLVGAPGAGAVSDGRSRGRVYAFDAPTRRLKFVVDADASGGALGAMFTSLVGDVNGDRVPDVYAADFSDATNGPSTGKVYVHSGVDGARLLSLTGEQAGDGFGIGSADVGDTNGDGHDDLAIGAWQYSRVAPSGGRVYLYSGKDASLLRTITGRIPGETFGFDATGVGDVDGDGAVDLLVTSSWSNIRGFRSGRLFVIAGTPRP